MPRDPNAIKLFVEEGMHERRTVAVGPDGQQYVLGRVRKAPPPTWACENRHLDPSTGGEFQNDGRRDRCEISAAPGLPVTSNE